MYQTEEQIGEKLQFDGASEEREEAIEGDKYSDESGTDPDSDLSDDELTRQNLSFLRTTRSGRNISINRAVFKWLSKVITLLRLLRLVIGLKVSRQFFNQWEAKPKPIAPCTRDFSRSLSELQVITRSSDWFIALFAPVVIGRSNCLGFGFSIVIWKPL